MMMLEAALGAESKARVSQSKPQTGGKEGAPRKTPGVDIPGAGLTNMIRGLGQELGVGSHVLGQPDSGTPQPGGKM